jgi:ABC-2 type transport system permease protein
MTTTTPETTAPAFVSRTVRPFYWSVRRELWEHRSLYIAPLATAGVVLLGILIGAPHLHHASLAGASLGAERRQQIALASFGFAALVVTLTSLIVGVLYCLGALHNERRDRSILFWKSLPVSDLTTVLSKASIPLVVLPIIVFVVTLALQLCMLAIVSLVAGGSTTAESYPPLLWIIQMLLYGLVVLALWYAPIWAWLLLVSAWARRTPFLWAFLPPLALIVLEKIAFDSSRFASFLAYRLQLDPQAFSAQPRGAFALPQPDPLGFLSNPDVWTGLAVAAAFLAAAVWVRRYREPI